MPETNQPNILSRVEGQIKWNNKKALCNKNLYRVFGCVALIGSILTIFVMQYNLAVAGICSVIVAVATGLQHFFKFQEHWTLYRSTAERLQRKHSLFINAAPPYTSPSLPLYTQRAETIMAEANLNWLAIVCKK